MKYMCLIYEPKLDAATMATPAFAAEMEEYMTLGARMAHVAKMLSGEGLKSAETATTVRLRDGKVETMDGPFAETREQLGGYYLIEAENLDAALAFAAAIPGARRGGVEVRPVMDY